MAVFSNPIANRSRWFWRLTLLTITLVLVVGAVLWRTLETTEITAIQTRVEGLKPLFTGIRWLLIALVTGLWPAIINRLNRQGRIDAAGSTQLLALRWRVLAWLILLELILGQNLLGRFIQVIQEGRA